MRKVQEMKDQVLKEIMQKMDGIGGSKLKAISPKFAKVEIASNDKSLAEKMKQGVIEGAKEDSGEELSEGGTDLDSQFSKLPEEVKSKLLKMAGNC